MTNIVYTCRIHGALEIGQANRTAKHPKTSKQYYRCKACAKVRSAKQYAKYPERAKAHIIRWQQENKDKVNAYKCYYYKLPKNRARYNKWVSEWLRQECAELSDYYVRKHLAKTMRLPASAIPQALIELKRVQMKRYIKRAKNNDDTENTSNK